ncbi:hypothetical protein ZWY2020_048217 [Hordeum vulgare]|nr:hypothetical protein ZWY2020_048217 [Hordeum vulgare]
MAPSEECGWLLYVSLAAKCCANGDGEPYRVVSFVAVLLAAFVVTSLLHWSSQGGAAWGRYWWTRKGLGIGEARVPGPRGFPVIGSMGLMTGLAHRKLAVAASGNVRRRRLMAFSMGETRVVVTADPDVARELLASPAFADRPVKESAYGLMFHRAIGFAPYGAYWRTLRRVSSSHLFSPRQVAASAAQLTVIARQMVDAMRPVGSAGIKHVEARRFLKRASLHNVMWSVFGRRYEAGRGGERGGRGAQEPGGSRLRPARPAQLVRPSPVARALRPAEDPVQVLRPRPPREPVCRQDHRRAPCRPERRRRRRRSRLHRRSALLQGSDKLSDADMTAVLWEMIFRGTDTVAVVIEWVLARLVLHQGVQARVHEELDRVVGPNRAVTESDAASLVFLQAVVKEVLRLHPPGPLLSWARLATSDVHVGGLLVPAGTTAMVNMWAITHDPAVWAKPGEFKPERFLAGPLSADFSVTGSDLRLAPFGSGRRSCPGKSLAMATVGFWVATLLHEFEWTPPPPSSAGPGGVDMSEVLRLSCEMAAPLEARLRPRRTV